MRSWLAILESVSVKSWSIKRFLKFRESGKSEPQNAGGQVLWLVASTCGTLELLASQSCAHGYLDVPEEPLLLEFPELLLPVPLELELPEPLAPELELGE